MINILYIIFGLNPGGTENQLLELVNRIDRERFRCHIACFRGLTKRRVSIASGTVQEIEFEGFRNFGFVRTVLELNALCKRERIDIVQSFFETENVLAAMLSMGRGVRHIVSIRSLLPDLSPAGKLLQGYVFRRSDLLLANSDAVKKRIQETSGVGDERIRICRNGIDMTRFPQRNGAEDDNRAAKIERSIDPDDFVVGMVANYREVKNHACLLRALKILLDRRKRFKAVLVGWGPLEGEIERMCRHLGIRERVLLAGRVDDPVPYLQAFDAGVLTSSFEGFPNAILEYMAAGLPVVSTEVGGSREAVLEGETGYLIASDDHVALAERLSGLLDDAPLRRRMGISGRRRAEEFFGMERMVRQYEELYWRLGGAGA